MEKMKLNLCPFCGKNTVKIIPFKNTFHKFMGWLTPDGKYVDTELNRYKLTSNFWWVEVNDTQKYNGFKFIALYVE